MENIKQFKPILIISTPTSFVRYKQFFLHLWHMQNGLLKIQTLYHGLKIETSHWNASQHRTPWSDAWGEKYNDGSPLPTRIHANRSISIITLGIPTVETIIEYSLAGAAWKRFSTSTPWQKPGPVTRSTTNKKLPHPDQRGHLAKTLESLLTKAWNRPPFGIKNATNLTSVKSQLKSILYC